MVRGGTLILTLALTLTLIRCQGLTEESGGDGCGDEKEDRDTNHNL